MKSAVIKKYFMAVALAVVMISHIFSEVPENEKCVVFDSGSPLKIDVVYDSILLGGGAAWALCGYFLPKTIEFGNDWDGKKFDKKDINPFDRLIVNEYNRTLDHLGTVGVFTSMALLPAVTFGTELCLKNLAWRDVFELGVIYTETFLWTYGSKNMLKYSHRRTRPFMYTGKVDEDTIDDHDYENSFPSGHACYPFMSAAFVSYAFCKYYPESDWKIPVIATSYCLAVANAALRVASGNHFMTDTMTGAAVGTAFGFAVPIFHALLADFHKKQDTVEILMTPSEVSFKIKL